MLTEYPAAGGDRDGTDRDAEASRRRWKWTGRWRMQRFDYASSKDQVMLRLMASLLEQPDFIWSPYAAFISPLHENTWSVGGRGHAYHSAEPDQ